MQILTASPGCMYTDGNTYGPTVCLPDGADASVWREVATEVAEREAAEREAARAAARDGPDADVAETEAVG